MRLPLYITEMSILLHCETDRRIDPMSHKFQGLTVDNQHQAEERTATSIIAQKPQQQQHNKEEKWQKKL
jgi:hypothetical protein